MFPGAIAQPPVQVPAQYAQRAWTREEALVELVRGRLEGLGPTTAAALAESLGVPHSDIDIALLALEGEGFAMRGSFTPQAVDTEWCERRLLARINRYTVKRLRQEIEPVGSADFLRFLFDWQHVTAGRAHGRARCGRRRHLPARRVRGRRCSLGSGDPSRAGVQL